MRANPAPLVIALAIAAGTLTGCSTWHWPVSSKWATDDPDYAAKYSEPYGKDQSVRIAKQLIDARHLSGKSGAAFAVGASGGPAAVSGEIGAFFYPQEWIEVGGGLTGIAGTGAESMFAGPEVRARLVVPARLSPFVGVGAYAGVNWFDQPAENDGIDNDDDLFVDEIGETKDSVNGFLSVYPEVGMHLWANGTWRLTGSARYYVSTEGRDADFWYFGLALGRVSRDDPSGDEADPGPAAPLRSPDWRSPEIESVSVEQAEVFPTGSESTNQRPPSFPDHYLPTN
jgi:hypothetical protein